MKPEIPHTYEEYDEIRRNKTIKMNGDPNHIHTHTCHLFRGKKAIMESVFIRLALLILLYTFVSYSCIRRGYVASCHTTATMANKCDQHERAHMIRPISLPNSSYVGYLWYVSMCISSYICMRRVFMCACICFVFQV